VNALQRAKILVVDDEAHGRLALQELLEGPDREVVLAASGEAALREVEAADFALVLLDVRMSGMDGFETARRIHDCPRAGRTPIIFLTGAYEDMASVIRGYAAGAVDYVVKPFPPEVVRSKVAVFVDLYYKNAELACQISERRKAEEALSRVNEELEAKIAERTRSLTAANERLREEIAMRKEVEEELRRAKQAAEAASVAKTEFLANMSHEIRTPLNAIVGMTELALQASPSGEIHEYLNAVKASSASLLSIIDDILDLSKIEAGRLNIESIPFSLRECVGDAMRTLALQAHEKGLELLCEIDRALPDDLVGDPLRLRQVVLNLVSNGVKFTERGEVGLCARCESTTTGEVVCHFSVRDTGIGILKDKQGAIFRRFLQADPSTSRLYGGSGLGLTIAARLVEMMGGRIWVESEPDRGSVFHFIARFDIARDRREDALPELHGVRVLVVDDHAESRRLIVETLRECGARVEGCEGADSALARLEVAEREEAPVDVVLLDDTLPDTDSYAAAARVASRRRQPGPAIVMLGVRRGDASFPVLVKPVKRAELYAAVKSACGGPVPAPAAPAALPAARRASKLSVLLVEDNPLSQKLAYYVLRKAGHEVTIADNGAAALRLHERKRFDLILMDVRMPRMDGLQATLAIREREKETGNRVPIIALTANAMAGDREACLHAGMDECLIKPIQPAQLLAAIARVGPAAPARRKPVLDRAALLERVGGERAVLQAMLTVYSRDCDRLMQEARRALTVRDGAGLGHALHTLCGMFGNLSAEAARAAAAELQSIDIALDAAAAWARFGRLEKEVRRLDQALAALKLRAPELHRRRHARSAVHAKSPG